MYAMNIRGTRISMRPMPECHKAGIDAETKYYEAKTKAKYFGFETLIYQNNTHL